METNDSHDYFLLTASKHSKPQVHCFNLGFRWEVWLWIQEGESTTKTTFGLFPKKKQDPGLEQCVGQVDMNRLDSEGCNMTVAACYKPGSSRGAA